MINKIGIDTNSNINSPKARKNKDGKINTNPNFKGVGALALSGIQACEKMPMVNVAVIDMLSAILPRTMVESMTNWFAGFEAFRRESSGLFVNCLIPGYLTLGIAKLINTKVMGNKANMAGCWADRNFIDRIEESYKNASKDNKVSDSIKNIIGNIEGFEGKNKILFKDAFSEDELKGFANRLADLSKSNAKDSVTKKEVKKIASEIIDKTRVAENITVKGGLKDVKIDSVASVLDDTTKFFKEFNKVQGKTSIEDFAKKSKKLVMTKSGLGLAIILPLAISMQYINRWITSKLSGVKGAPIYDDFGKNKDIQPNPKAKEGLLKQKVISIASMLGVSLLSMMKKPSLNMLEFKGPFPTMDQARIISTATFASRMAAADDKNELAEATVRDIATFSSLYFLGDYAAKGAATLIQNRTGVSLLNETKKLDKDAGLMKKLWHWVKDVNIKSSEEVVGKTAEELKRARNLRSVCQATNLGVSLALLGIVIPIFTRNNTKKKHAKEIQIAQEQAKNLQVENKKQADPVTPLNVKYSNLTAGFRSEKH